MAITAHPLTQLYATQMSMFRGESPWLLLPTPAHVELHRPLPAGGPAPAPGPAFNPAGGAPLASPGAPLSSPGTTGATAATALFVHLGEAVAALSPAKLKLLNAALAVVAAAGEAAAGPPASQPAAAAAEAAPPAPAPAAVDGPAAGVSACLVLDGLTAALFEPPRLRPPSPAAGRGPAGVPAGGRVWAGLDYSALGG